MRKFLTVCLWLGLAACVCGLISMAGSGASLRAQLKTAQRKNDALQTLYDRAKEELASAREAQEADREEWRTARGNLEGRIADLTASLEAARAEADARQAADGEWERRQTAWAEEKQALTESLDAAEARLSQVTALLLPPTETPAPEPTIAPSGLFSLFH